MPPTHASTVHVMPSSQITGVCVTAPEPESQVSVVHGSPSEIGDSEAVAGLQQKVPVLYVGSWMHAPSEPHVSAVQALPSSHVNSAIHGGQSCTQPMSSRSIDWKAEDPYGQFAHRRETAESGAILVRPDFIVGWRANEVSASSTQDLLAAMAQILGRVDGELLETSHVDHKSLKDDWLP